MGREWLTDEQLGFRIPEANETVLVCADEQYRVIQGHGYQPYYCAAVPDQWTTDVTCGERVPDPNRAIEACTGEPLVSIPGCEGGDVRHVAAVTREWNRWRRWKASRGTDAPPGGVGDGGWLVGEPRCGELSDALPVLRIRCGKKMRDGQYPRDLRRKRSASEGMGHDQRGQPVKISVIPHDFLGNMLDPRFDTCELFRVVNESHRTSVRSSALCVS